MRRVLVGTTFAPAMPDGCNCQSYNQPNTISFPLDTGGTVTAIWHWILQVTGTANESSKWYAFWSGFGADFTEGAIFISLYALYRRHKCQSCWRPALKGGLGRVEGTHYETCHRHTNDQDHDSLREQHKSRHPEMHQHLAKGSE